MTDIDEVRQAFERWQLDQGFTDPMWLEMWDGEKYLLNDLQADWEKWLEVERGRTE